MTIPYRGLMRRLGGTVDRSAGSRRRCAAAPRARLLVQLRGVVAARLPRHHVGDQLEDLILAACLRVPVLEGVDPLVEAPGRDQLIEVGPRDLDGDLGVASRCPCVITGPGSSTRYICTSPRPRSSRPITIFSGASAGTAALTPSTACSISVLVSELDISARSYLLALEIRDTRPDGRDPTGRLQSPRGPRVGPQDRWQPHPAGAAAAAWAPSPRARWTSRSGRSSWPPAGCRPELGASTRPSWRRPTQPWHARPKRPAPSRRRASPATRTGRGCTEPPLLMSMEMRPIRSSSTQPRSCTTTASTTSRRTAASRVASAERALEIGAGRRPPARPGRADRRRSGGTRHARAPPSSATET